MSRPGLVFGVLVLAAVLLTVACGGGSSADSSADSAGDGGGGDASAGGGAFLIEPNTVPPGSNIKVTAEDLPEQGVVFAELVAVGENGEVKLSDLSIIRGRFSSIFFVPEDLEPGVYNVEIRFKNQDLDPLSSQLTVAQ